jgi:hypothetical protein
MSAIAAVSHTNRRVPAAVGYVSSPLCSHDSIVAKDRATGADMAGGATPAAAIKATNMVATPAASKEIAATEDPASLTRASSVSSGRRWGCPPRHLPTNLRACAIK